MGTGSCGGFVAKKKTPGRGVFRKELYVWPELAELRMNSVLLSQSFLTSRKTKLNFLCRKEKFP